MEVPGTSWHIMAQCSAHQSNAVGFLWISCFAHQNAAVPSSVGGSEAGLASHPLREREMSEAGGECCEDEVAPLRALKKDPRGNSCLPVAANM